MAHGDTVRIQPQAMHIASQALSTAATDLHTRLLDLDTHVRNLLAGWHGDSGGAYSHAWDSWHRGAGEVQQGLSMLAKTIGVTGVAFAAQEQASAQTVDGVYRG